MKHSGFVIFFKGSFKAYLFILFFLLILSTAVTVSGAIPSSERTALIALYNSTNGDEWTDSSGWKTAPLDSDGFAMPGTESGWYGITVTDDSVEHISLSGNNLAGAIPADLEDLTNLKGLWLESNQLTGAIPAEIGNLSNLTDLDLEDNHLTGAIPPELGSLSGLTQLDLSRNQFTGAVPSGIWDLINLEYLSLYDNELTGTIPAEIGNLANLTFLNLGANQFEGGIPPELWSMTNLEHLDLLLSTFSGTIPAEIGNLTNLTYLSLGGRDIEGVIPPEIGNLSNLEYLNLAYNHKLTGGIPPEIGNLTDLQVLYMHKNELKGEIPPEIGNLTNLRMLILSNNNLEGIIPPELGNLINLEVLNLSQNMLEGPIPQGIGELINLKGLDLSQNIIEGPFPQEICELINLYQLSLNGNSLSGEIPSELSNLYNLTGLNLSYNGLETQDGALSAFIETFDPDWESTQTLPPENVTAGTVTANSVVINWSPTQGYITEETVYLIAYSTTSGGPYTYSYGSYAMPKESGTAVRLQPSTRYYFVVQTQNPSEGSNNYDTVTSGYSNEVSAVTSAGGGGGGGGGGGSGIFGNIGLKDLTGYHFDWTEKDGTKVYMPVTGWARALKGAQTHVEGFAPGAAAFIREKFDSLERKAKSDPDGLLSRAGTSFFPLFGRIAEIYLYIVDRPDLMDKAYKDTTISISEFNALYEQGIATSSHHIDKTH